MLTAAAAVASAQTTVSARLTERIAAEGTADVLVLYGDYPDLSGAGAFATKEDKARYVFEALRQNARRHRPLLARLDAQRLSYRHYPAANAVYVPNADVALAAALAREEGVARVAALDAWRVEETEEYAPATALTLEARSNAPEWGLVYMGVPEVWAQGIRGAGAVVGGQDTGYDWTHPALKPKYRGYDAAADTAAHDYHWFDAVVERSPLNPDDANPCGFSSPVPCDDSQHGTHTMGTMVGSDSSNQVGVAPEAEWVACRSMERGWGRPETYLGCFEWFLAPTDVNGENPDPAMAPDVIANSWYCPELEGCDTTTFAAFDNVIAALRASGVVVVASAGNFGRRGCASVARIPAQSPGAVAVGAHDELGALAAFSSLGSADAPLDGPDIVAPGVGTRSTIPGGGYNLKSGTSMAGPHVAGLVALMISANPALRGQVDSIEAILYRTATPPPAVPADTCSAPGGPNQVYGNGLAQAERAVREAIAFGGVSQSVGASAKTFATRVAPNPVGRGFALVVPAEAVGARLVVRDATGRLVEDRRLRRERTDVLAERWPAGTYSYHVTGEAGTAAGKLVKL